MKTLLFFMPGKGSQAKRFSCSIIAINLAVLIIYSLSFGTYSIEASESANAYEPKKMSTQPKLRLAIPDFEKSGGEARYDYLTRSLPEILTVGLIENERIEYVDRKEFERIASKKFSYEQLQKNPDLIFENEMLDELKIDLIVRGDFFEYRGKIRLEMTLQDRRHEKFIKISSKVVDTRELYSGIADIAKKLNAEINAIRGEIKAISLAILCFIDKSEILLAKSQPIGKDLAISLISHLDLKEEISLVPWSMTKDLCWENTMSYEEILMKVNAGALLRGEFLIDKEIITLSPILYIGEMRILTDKLLPIKLTTITGNLNDYYELEDNLARDVTNVLNAIVEEGGKWNIDSLLFSSDNPEVYLEKGKKYLDLEENTYLAALMFIRAIEANHDFDEAHYYLGIVRARQKRYDEAISEFQNIIERNPENSQAYAELGDVYFKQNDYNKALEAFKEASDIDVDLSDIHLRLGEVYYVVGQYDKTIQELQKALQREADNPRIYNLLGRAYRSRGDEEKAISSYKKALEIDPDRIDSRTSLKNIYLDKGRSLFGAKKYERSLTYFTLAKDLEPNASIFAWLIYNYSELEKAKEAIKQFQEAINLNHVNAIVYNNAGSAFYDLKRYEEAVDAFNKAIKLDPKATYSLSGRGNALTQLGNYQEAISSYNEAIKINPEFMNAYNGKGWSLDQAGRSEEAIEVLDKAITIDPQNIPAYQYKAFSFSRLGRYEDALEVINEAIKIDPENYLSYNGKGNYLAYLGRYEEAISLYDKAIEINPTDVTAYNGKSWMFNNAGRYKEAVKYADMAIEIDPGLANPYNHKGFGSYQLGKHKKGIELIEKAIELDPEYGGSYFNLSKIYVKEEKTSQAILYLEKAIQMNMDYKLRAKESKYFMSIKEKSEFIKLIKNE